MSVRCTYDRSDSTDPRMSFPRYGIHIIKRRLAVLRRQPCITSRSEGRSCAYSLSPLALSVADNFALHRESQRTFCSIRGPSRESHILTLRVTYNPAFSCLRCRICCCCQLYFVVHCPLSTVHRSSFTFALAFTSTFTFMFNLTIPRFHCIARETLLFRRTIALVIVQHTN